MFLIHQQEIGNQSIVKKGYTNKHMRMMKEVMPMPKCTCGEIASYQAMCAAEGYIASDETCPIHGVQ
jgi:hypothetical protein